MSDNIERQVEVLLPDELSGWEVEVSEGDGLVQVIMQLRRDGRVVADCGGRAEDVAGALAQAIEHAQTWLEDQG